MGPNNSKPATGGSKKGKKKLDDQDEYYKFVREKNKRDEKKHE